MTSGNNCSPLAETQPDPLAPSTHPQPTHTPSVGTRRPPTGARPAHAPLGDGSCVHALSGPPNKPRRVDTVGGLTRRRGLKPVAGRSHTLFLPAKPLGHES